MNAKHPHHRKKNRHRRDRDIAVLETLGMKVRCSPTPDFIHPIVVALVRVMKQWLRRHRIKTAPMMKRALLSRETLRKMRTGKSWYSLNVAARICDAMGLDIVEAICVAARRCARR